MVAHLVRLKLTLLANGLRRSPWQVVGLVVGLLYALGVLVMVLVALGALSVQDAELRRVVTVLGGALLVLGWWLVPLVAFGVDATMDPDRFARFPVPRRDLVLGMGLAAVVGVPGVMTTIGAVATALSWWRSPVAVVAGLVGAVLALATAVVGSRLLTTVLGPLVGGRRVREVLTLVLVVPLILLGPIMAGVGSTLEAGWDSLPRVADVVAWTPFGAPWALAADAEAGAWGTAAVRALLSAGVLVLLGAAWSRALAAALVRPRGDGGGGGRRTGLGALGRFPATPVGAIAARCVTYWVRDPRYAAGVVVVPLLPFLVGFIAGDSLALLVLGAVAAYFMGWAVSADIAYDGTAFWTHVAAPVTGAQDRAGRAWAAGVLGLPVVTVMVVVSLAMTGRWDLTVPVLGGSVGVLLASIGAASTASALTVYPVPKPGDSPFSTPQGGSTALMTSQLAGTALLGLILAPVVALAVWAVVGGSAVVGAVAGVVAVAYGAVLLAVGLRLGARLYDRRAPHHLARLVAMG